MAAFLGDGEHMRFGEMLRHARTAKGLTQAELGAGVHSTHFISLLERGLRQPTPDMVQHFATRLGMDVQTLTWWVEPPGAEDRPSLTAAMFAANSARELQDNALAASEAEHAAIIAYEQRNAPVWWDMSMLRAQSLIALRRPEEAEAVLLQMETSPLMIASAELQSVVQGRLSMIARTTGRLHEAVDLAHRSVASAAELPELSPVRLQAAFILIAALAVKGDLDEAWEVAMGLDITGGAPSVPSLLVARGAWAVGNIAFRRGEVEIGREQHALAARLLVPQADLETWAEFHKASATFKLQAGIVDESVHASLRDAARGLALVGTQLQRLELDLVQARLALLTSDLPRGKELLDVVDAHRTVLDFETAAELEDCLGQYHAANGEPAPAVHHLTEAARLYSDAGAEEKARELRELIRSLTD
ncbi:helix-turn-helix domain-containing protein [Arthrobacter agilis]|uniref:helix-turn-helix domain-containing protein n=1 Tax=Arthrobacter agilis TaxID=37921 RepID=UPI00278A23FC|nr:helix-turn-helix transcriptional regulator [Arthrobacter agilis]MDQ0733835.1 transcriptional regulator with XRE-family HTH domain [Arthrobacter agilis]